VALVGNGNTRADRQPVSLNAGLNRGVRATAKRNRTVAALSPFRQKRDALLGEFGVFVGDTSLPRLRSEPSPPGGLSTG
jgi:hypothetical protein